MANRALVFALLSIIAVASFAHAECVLPEPPKAGNGFFLSVDPSSLSGQLPMQVYLQKKGGTGYCIMAAELAQQASGFSLSVLPADINFSTSYGMYYATITATASAASVSPETVNILFLDKDTGAELATVPVRVSIAETAAPQGTGSHTCTKENTTYCTEMELIALQVGPSLIEENMTDVYLLVGIIIAFALIVLVFFVVIPRK